MDSIQKLQVEISFFSEALYPTFEEKLMTMLNNILLPEIEKIMEQALPPQKLLRLNELIIDLQPIDYEDFENKFAQQFIEKLTDALRSAVAHAQPTTLPLPSSPTLLQTQTDNIATLLHPNQAALDTLLYFLDYGVLPWWENTSTFMGIDQLIEKIAKENPVQLRQKIWQNYQNHTFIKRLLTQANEEVISNLLLAPTSSQTPEKLQEITQHLIKNSAVNNKGTTENYLQFLATYFKTAPQKTDFRNKILLQLAEKQLISLVQFIQPIEAPFIIRYAHDLQHTHSQRPFTPANQPTFRQAMWEFIFTYLVEEKSTVFNRKLFIANSIKQLAARFNRSYQELLAALTSVALTVQKSLKLKTLLPTILQELQADLLPTALQNTKQNNNISYLQTAQTSLQWQVWKPVYDTLPDSPLHKLLDDPQQHIVQVLLATALTSSTLSAEWLAQFRKTWQQLIATYPAETTKVIRRLGSQAMYRQRLVQRWTLRQIRNTLQLVEPQEAGFIWHYAQDLQTIQQQKNAIKSNNKDFYQAKWELIFAYLLADRGSAFNRKSFIKTTLQGLARRFNTNYEILLTFFIKILQDKTQYDTQFLQLGNLLLLLFKDLQKEQIAIQKPAINLQITIQIQTQRHFLYHLLRYGVLPYSNQDLMPSPNIYQRNVSANEVKELRHEKNQFIDYQSIVKNYINLTTAVYWQNPKVFVPVLLALKNSPRSWEKLVVELPATLLQQVVASLPPTLLLENQAIANLLIPKLPSPSPFFANLLTVYLQQAQHSNFQHFYVVPSLLKKIWLDFYGDFIQRWLDKLPAMEGEKIEKTIQILQKELFEFSTTKQIIKTENFVNDKPNKQQIIDWKDWQQQSNLLKKQAYLPLNQPALWAAYLQFSKQFALLFSHLKPYLSDNSKLSDKLHSKPYLSDNSKLSDNLRSKPYLSDNSKLSDKYLSDNFELSDKFQKLRTKQTKRLFEFLQHSFTLLATQHQNLTTAQKEFTKKLLLFLSKNYKQDTAYFLTTFTQQFAPSPHLTAFLATLPKEVYAADKQLVTATTLEVLQSYFAFEKSKFIIKNYTNATLEKMLVGLLTTPPSPLLFELLPTRSMRNATVTYFTDFATTTWHRAAYLYNSHQYRQIWQHTQLFWRVFPLVSADYLPQLRVLRTPQMQIAFVWYVLAGGYAGSLSAKELLNEWLGFVNLHTKIDKKLLQTILFSPLTKLASNLPTTTNLQQTLRNFSLPIEQNTKQVTNQNLALQAKQKNIKKEQKQENNTYKIPESIYVANAGLVLLSPYLVVVFSRLGWMDKGQWKTEETLPLPQQKALHLLQYLAFEGKNPAEYDLALNKLLCGLPLGEVAEKEIELTTAEQETANGLLSAVIKQWVAMQNSSLLNFRVSFLQRTGRLTFHEDHWELHVEQRAYDVLLDRLPWAFHLVKLAWMPLPLFVYWRNKA